MLAVGNANPREEMKCGRMYGQVRVGVEDPPFVHVRAAYLSCHAFACLDHSWVGATF